MTSYRLMMLGPPGAGKGTQAKRIAERLSIPHVSTGDMLRDARRKGTEMGKKAGEYMDAGDLVPDEVVIGIVKDRLSEEDASGGFVLDGFPRTRPQAEALTSMGIELDRVIEVAVPDEEVIRRLGGRLSCPSCGAIYHVEASPPEEEDVCDQCSHEGLIVRDDDRPEAIKQRLVGYHKQTAPLIEYYSDQEVLWRVDGVGEMDEITEAILEELGVG